MDNAGEIAGNSEAPGGEKSKKQGMAEATMAESGLEYGNQRNIRTSRSGKRLANTRTASHQENGMALPREVSARGRR